MCTSTGVLRPKQGRVSLRTAGVARPHCLKGCSFFTRCTQNQGRE